jgi:hypothetical protein
MRHMRPDFDVLFWREQVCAPGDVDTYNEGAYKARKKQVRDIRTGVPFALVIVGGLILLIGITAGGGRGACIGWLIVVVLALSVMTPLFVAI